MIFTWTVAFLALGALAASALQWILHRSLQRKALDTLRGRHLQQLLNGNRKLESAKRQIAQLQQALAAMQLELKRRRDRVESAAPRARPPVPMRDLLLRELMQGDERPRLPADGFADTMPAAQYAHADELLLER